MKKQLSYKEIGDYLGKSENTIKGWKQKFPKLLELVQIGAFCKHNELDIEKIERLIELKTMFKEQGK